MLRSLGLTFHLPLHSLQELDNEHQTAGNVERILDRQGHHRFHGRALAIPDLNPFAHRGIRMGKVRKVYSLVLA